MELGLGPQKSCLRIYIPAEGLEAVGELPIGDGLARASKTGWGMERKGPSSYVFSQTKAALLRAPSPGLLFRTWHLRLPVEEVAPGTVHTIWGPVAFNECSAVQCLPACCASYTNPGSRSAGCGCAGNTCTPCLPGCSSFPCGQGLRTLQ